MKRWMLRLKEKRYKLAEKIYNCKFHQKKLLKLYLLIGDVIAGCGLIRWKWEWEGRH